MTLGEKLRSLRKEKKMTLNDVAEKAGYSKALISRIENDSVSPSISSLMKIAPALEITLQDLFTAVEGCQALVTKKAQREPQGISDSAITAEVLNKGEVGDKMAATVLNFEPGAIFAEKTNSFVREEWWHLLKGKLEVIVNGVVYDLKEGDSIYITPMLTHKWRNPARKKACALVVATPPS